MKILKILIILFIPAFCCGQKIITDDINNFWIAYDSIAVEKDSLKQLDLIRKLYIDKGTPGLNGIMRARRYSAEEYVFAINNYPNFWTSIRNNTLKSNQFSEEIQTGIEKLKVIYPNLKPVDIYFEIGALRTSGTTMDGMSLIGSEIALADSTIITSEFDAQYPHLRSYFNTNPIKQSTILINKYQRKIKLTDEEKYLMLESDVGEGIFFVGLKHVALKVVASYTEDQIITTNPAQVLAIRKSKQELEASQ